MQGIFIPQNLKLHNPNQPKTRAKASSKASSSGEHVHLFCMVYDREKQEGFPSRTFVGFSCLIACRNMARGPKVSCCRHLVVFTCLWERGRRLRCNDTMHSPPCVLVVVCIVRKPRHCLSYNRRRGRIHLAACPPPFFLCFSKFSNKSILSFRFLSTVRRLNFGPAPICIPVVCVPFG